MAHTNDSFKVTYHLGLATIESITVIVLRVLMDSQLFLASKKIPGFKFLLVTFVVIFTWTSKERIFMLVLMGQTSKYDL